MPDVRARVIALCRRGFAPVGVSSLVRPREPYPPHPVAQRELELFLERSAHRFVSIDTVLEALFDDAVGVGVMRAAVVFENGVPEGLVHLDAREAVRTFDGFVAPAEADRVENAIDAWAQAPVSAEVRWRWQAQLFGADAPDHVLFPIVRHLQGRCAFLLRPLLGRVLAAQGVRHALASCRFADPSEPGPSVRATTAAAPAPRRGGGRPKGSRNRLSHDEWAVRADKMIELAGQGVSQEGIAEQFQCSTDTVRDWIAARLAELAGK